MALNRRLIMDVGVSEGDDTAFYLGKGFDVVGVEADPTLHAGLRDRFASEIAEHRLHLLQRAATGSTDQVVGFWHDNARQGHSRLAPDGQSPADGNVSEFQVPTIDWRELREVAGVPYYLKIDIEGAEPEFLSSMIGSPDLPIYISSEMPNFRPAELLHAIGYRHFRLVNQTLWPHLDLPNPPLEGEFVGKPNSNHWSGPFGRELPGNRWFSFDELKALHEAIHHLWLLGTIIPGWLDCHACLPEAAL
jgi:FkbM family methyltransferase